MHDDLAADIRAARHHSWILQIITKAAPPTCGCRLITPGMTLSVIFQSFFSFATLPLSCSSTDKPSIWGKTLIACPQYCDVSNKQHFQWPPCRFWQIAGHPPSAHLYRQTPSPSKSLQPRPPGQGESVSRYIYDDACLAVTELCMLCMEAEHLPWRRYFVLLAFPPVALA